MAVLFVGTMLADFTEVVPGRKYKSTYCDPAYAPYAVGFDDGLETEQDFGVEHTTIDLSMRIRWSDSNTADYFVFVLRNAAGANVLRLDTENGLGTFRDGAETALYSTGNPNALTHYCIRIEIHATAGSIKIWENSAPVYSATNIDTTFGGTIAGVQKFRCACSGNYASARFSTFSEVVITNSESTLDWRVKSLLPNGAGFYSDWLGSFADVSDDDVDTAVRSDTPLDRISFDMTDYSAPANTKPHSVFVKASCFALEGAGTPESISLGVRSGATDQLAAPSVANAASDRGHKTVEFDQNPATAGGWTWADINTLELLLRGEA